MVKSASKTVTPKSLVTGDIVRAALTADKGAKAILTDWKVVDFTKKGDNFASVVTSVEVKYELNDQDSEVVYVVKLKPCTSIKSPDVFIDTVFEKEASFYLNLLPELNHVLMDIGQRRINFPKCFYASLEKGKEIILLEDLRQRSFKMFDRKRGLDEAHATLVLRELARLHAASLVLQNKYPGEDLSEKYPYLKTDMHHFLVNCDETFLLFKGNLNFAQEILKKVGGYERAVAWIDTVIPQLADIFYEQLNLGEPKVVCHGDCWNNNLLFRYDKIGHPEEVMLLDLQMVSYSLPTPELNYLLYTSMTGGVRKPKLQTFLNCYHDALTNIMEAAKQEIPFTQEQLIKDFRNKSYFGAIFGMISTPVTAAECGETVDSSESDELFEDKMRNTRARAMDTLNTNPLLKQRFLSLIDEIMEIGIIQ